MSLSASLYDGNSKAGAAEAAAAAPANGGGCGEYGKLTLTLSLFTLGSAEGALAAAGLAVVAVFLSFSFKLISDMVDVFAPAAANRLTSRAGVLSDVESN